MSDSEVFTIKQIIRYESRYIKKYSFGKLINKASSKISDFIDQDFSNKKLLFVCGPGNNGGDGYYVGIYLYKAGFDVKIINALEHKTKSHLCFEAFNNARDLNLMHEPLILNNL